MRLGVLADAHGNAEGLGLCLQALRTHNVDTVVFLGDALGYFPYGAAVVHLLLRADALCLMGNHEAMALGHLPVPPHKEEVLALARSCRHVPARWLRQVERTGPMTHVLWEGMRMLFVHATPQNPLMGRVADALNINGDVDDMDADMVVMGHTHRPALTQRWGTMWLNPGSCGYPRDHGSLLSYAVLDTATGSAQVWRIPFAFRSALLQHCHEDVRTCTRRICATPYGQIWSGNA